MKVEAVIEQKILRAVNGDLAAVTPGLCLQVVKSGRVAIDLRIGRTWSYYDLASLTKIIFTVPMFMQLADSRRGKLPKIDLTDRIQSYLPDWPHRAQKIKEILSHSAGLPAWAPFYKKMRTRRFADESERRAQLKKLIFQTPSGSKRRAIYSDIDFILLGFVLEKIYGESLIEIWHSHALLREIIPNLHFNPIGLNGHCHARLNRACYAPTESCPWRKKTLQGEVHDDNTWSFGGVSTHAGLFGTPDDVTKFGTLLRSAWRGGRVPHFPSPAIVQKFARRAIPRKMGDWSLGFMLPTKGRASCGRYFSPLSFGHTGFTGTSIWYDPKRDLLVTLLSNRVHPTRLNNAFLSLRPQIHDIVVETIV